MGTDDLLQALLAKRVLTRQYLARRVESFQAYRALQQVVQHALVHRGTVPRLSVHACTQSFDPSRFLGRTQWYLL